MVAFASDENGILTTPQINDLVTLIKHVRWREVEAYIDATACPVDLPALEGRSMSLT